MYLKLKFYNHNILCIKKSSTFAPKSFEDISVQSKDNKCSLKLVTKSLLMK